MSMITNQTHKLRMLADALGDTYGLRSGIVRTIIEAADTIEALSAKARQNGDAAVAEYCPECETEIEMRWDVETMGFKAFCPVCGNRLMLCSECRCGAGGGCDYDSSTDTCKHNRGNHEKENNKAEGTD